MNQAIVITPHVINTLKSLPSDEGKVIATALANEMLLGMEADGLTPTQRLVYEIIRFYVNRDTLRSNPS